VSRLVSIVLPVKNARTSLPRAVASIRAQTWSDWELIVVDDGSTDGSCEWLEELAKEEARLRLRASPGRGLVVALNAGLAAAEGDWIARMDADDEMRPERLARQVAALTADPDLGLVGCRVDFGGDRTGAAGYAAHVDWLNTVLTAEEVRLARFVESPFAHPSVMFRRGLVARHGGYREGDFPEDYELWLRWLEAGVRMAKVPEALLVWHDSPERASRCDPRYAPDAFYRVKAGYLAGELARSGQGRAVWIAGAGRPTRKRAALLEVHGVEIAGYVDIDPRKIGGRVDGRPVVGPADLPPSERAVVLSYVANRGGRDKVRRMLVAQSRREGCDFWLCA